MPRRSLTAVTGLLVLTLATTLVGCSDTTRLPDPTPEATADPLFATDEEALAAAVEVYERYLATVDAAVAPGAEKPDLTTIAEGEALSDLELDFAEFEERDVSSTGTRTLTATRFQSQFESNEPAGLIVALYSCEDVSDVNLVDSSGTSLVDPDRNPLTPFEVQVLFADDGRQVLSSRDFWEEGGICDAQS